MSVGLKLTTHTAFVVVVVITVVTSCTRYMKLCALAAAAAAWFHCHHQHSRHFAGKYRSTKPYSWSVIAVGRLEQLARQNNA